MTDEDLPALIRIEQRSFPSPWSISTYRQELRNRSGSYWVVRATQSDAGAPPLLAYGGFWLLGDEAHITTIATHPGYRRRGLGEWLMLHLISAARERGMQHVTLEVRVSNHGAIALYSGLGFVEVGLRRGYYHDNDEDALLFTLFNISDEAVWAPLRARMEAIPNE
jgi:ribosomal-protein-alanine N-acetyltransferase